jgi:transposase
MLKNRIHQTLIAHGHPRPGVGLYTRRGRALLAQLELPEPWRETVQASLALIDALDVQIAELERELRRLGPEHPYVPLLRTVPGIAWVLAYTIASEIGEITRFPSPRKLIGYSGLCPRVYQSGEHDRRGPLAKNGPACLRWTLVEAAHNTARHPLYRQLAAHQRARHGSAIATITIARKLTEAIWWMLTRNQPFAPAGARSA